MGISTHPWEGGSEVQCPKLTQGKQILKAQRD